MFEYKMIEARGKEQAEKLMNQYAKLGWRVAANAHYYTWGHLFFITLERKLNEQQPNQVKF